MNRRLLIIALLVLTSSIAIDAQQVFTDAPPLPARLDLAVGYTMIRANAPPSDCQCFTMSGGSLSADYRLLHWLSASGDLTETRANKISGLDQNLRLMTFAGGPKITWVNFRISPFVEFLAGKAHATDSYFPIATGSTTSASSFYYSVGGGFDWNLTPHFAVRPIDARFVHTAFPNSSDDSQRQLQLEAGIVIHVGHTETRHFRE